MFLKKNTFVKQFIYLILIAFLFLAMGDKRAICIYAEEKAVEETFEQKVEKVAKKLKKGKIGVYVYDLTNDKPIYYKNPDLLLSLASNQKIITTAAALQILGYDYKFQTKLVADGTVNKGVLEGDLVVIGSGDPSISPHFYKDEEGPKAVFIEWAKVLKNKGIKEISGNLIVDASMFDQQLIPNTYPKDQLTWWYTAQSAPLSFNDNCVDIKVTPGAKTGDPAKVEIYPDTSYVKLTNKCKTGTKKSKHRIIIYRKKGTNEIIVKGKAKLNASTSTYYVTVHEPHLYAATVLKECFEAEGIKIKGKLLDNFDENKYKDRKGILVRETPLLEVARVCNKRSQNLYADLILRTLGAVKNGKGSFASGSKVISDFMCETIGLNEKGINIVDGSGLSCENKCTAKGLGTLLRYIFKSKEYEKFRDTLAIAGQDRSMRKRLKDEKYHGKVWAKTGYINEASTFSGYIKSENGNIYAFSILINDFSGSNWNNVKIQEEICKLIFDIK